MLGDVLVLTLSSFGLQPWKFVVVDDPETREKTLDVSHGQRQVSGAFHLVVFTTNKNLGEQHINAHLKRIAEVRRGFSRTSKPILKVARKRESEIRRKSDGFNRLPR